jgi:amidophosphoribosyltransferase
VGRTFIEPSQVIRDFGVKLKLNPVRRLLEGKSVVLVDDSIVRGTTSREIVQMAREAGARKVFFASAAPPVRFANVYGIDMPTRDELIATGRSDEEIAREIGADQLIYQDLSALIDDVRSVNPKVTSFEDSCFSGNYVTGDVTQAYLDGVEAQRREGTKQAAFAASQLDLNLEVVD